MKNDVVRKTVCDKLVAKVNDIDISGFVLKTKYDTDKSESERKISDTIRLVQKLDYDAKITEIENKIPNISGIATTSALTAVENEIANLVTKTDFDTKLIRLNDKINSNKTKNLLVKHEFKDWNIRSYFRGKSHFEEDFLFPPMSIYFIRLVNSDCVLDWKYKGTSDESIKSPSIPSNFPDPSLDYFGTK